MAPQIFWFMATLEVAVSIGFAVRMRMVPTPELSSSHFVVARSQRKDNWLACAVIWIVILAGDFSMRQPLLLAGAAALAWLTQRTLHRMRMLHGKPNDLS